MKPLINTMLTIVLATMSGGVSAAQGRTVLEGTWQGTFTCGEKVQSVKLMMESFRDHHTGIFIFSDIGQGRFNFTAYLKGKDGFETKPGAWVTNPSGSRSVALVGTIAAGKMSIKGVVATPGCSSFEINKIH